MTFTISGTSGLTFPDSSTMTTGQQACKAWAQWNGSTGTIAASYNVSSVTRLASGRYTVTFTNAFSDAKYAITGTASMQGPSVESFLTPETQTTYSTTAVTVRTVGVGGAYADCTVTSVACFR